MENHNYSSSLILGGPSRPGVASPALEKAIEYELNHGHKLDPNMDRKKFRRTISNRLSAQRSRMRKSQYINAMEKRVIELQELISTLAPEIEICKDKRESLQIENDSLQQLLMTRSNETKLHELELEEKKNELQRLKELQKVLYEEGHGSSSRPQQVHIQNQSGPDQFCIRQPVEISKTEEEDDENIDQYFNFEAINDHPSSGSYDI